MPPYILFSSTACNIASMKKCVGMHLVYYYIEIRFLMTSGTQVCITSLSVITIIPTTLVCALFDPNIPTSVVAFQSPKLYM